MVEYCVRDSTMLSKPLGLLHAVLVLEYAVQYYSMASRRGQATHATAMLAGWLQLVVHS